jgi:hypothetical protein
MAEKICQPFDPDEKFIEGIPRRPRRLEAIEVSLAIDKNVAYRVHCLHTIQYRQSHIWGNGEQARVFNVPLQ